ncbi:flagellar brake protein [Cupriavidus lacunae]|uniref:Flagellar brake protein YcgR n=1 Tax=Cupriavidus lacunae TaxID=2666307 RepID=A0A370NYW3_9BURK|nr:flagellar brake protein [Cupriavidus lacunae]RDK10821.1 flagellar brake protein [Cupriavidus lacunae]
MLLESMNQHDASGPADTGAESDLEPTDDRYRLTHNSQVGTVLRDLSWQKCMLSVRTRSAHQFVTSILHVDPVNRTFVFDWCNAEPERMSLMTSEENAFSGLLRGVPVNFVVGQPAATRYEEGPAFVVEFPQKLYHFQRRRHFRARTLVTKGYRCEMQMPDKTVLGLDIADLSLSGVGLRSKTVTSEHLPVGTTVGKCRLDFRELGKLELDMQVVGHWLVGHDDSAIHHFGCAFVNPDGRIENFLQRLVFALELAHRG